MIAVSIGRQYAGLAAHRPIDPKRAAALWAAYDSLEERIETLRQQEEVDALRPELDGNEIGAVLGIPPGPELGRAYRFLLELRLEQGPVGKEAAAVALRDWAAEHGVGPG